MWGMCVSKWNPDHKFPTLSRVLPDGTMEIALKTKLVVAQQEREKL